MTAQELKNSILQLAVQGKLVPQCKEDEPASELTRQIIERRNQVEKIISKRCHLFPKKKLVLIFQNHGFG